MQRVTAHVSEGAPLEQALRDCLKRLAAQTAATYVLILPVDARPSRELVPVLVQGAQALPKGCELIVVHPSPSLGFMVSSAALRCPHLRMTASAAATELERADAGAPGAAADPVGAHAEAIAKGFAAIRRTARTTCVIVLDAGSRPAPSIVPFIERELQRAPQVRTVYLVHPLPAAGFVASTLGLRMPNVTFRAVTSLAAVPASSTVD